MSFNIPNTTAPGALTFGAIPAKPLTVSFGAAGGGGDASGAPPLENKEPPKTFQFGVATTSAGTFAPQTTLAAPTFAKAPAVASSFSIPDKNAKPAEGITNLSTATKTTQSAPVSQTPQLNFSQLEEYTNKWTLELEEQEKIFTNQATQINAWDNLLISNNDKIVALNEAVQKVTADQQSLEQELEFIATQHSELEESIAPLEKELLNMPQVDIERTQTYSLVENLDTQLKQMSEDLKEVIDYLNEANKAQDNSDPIVQIGKILNAHMSSLQWIESSSSVLSSKLEDISKMHESLKRDTERPFRLTYYE